MHVRYLYLGSVVLLLGLSLWLMEEAALLAPVLFPKRWLPLGGDGSFQAIFSAVALSGFPLGGIAIRPADSSAARSLLHTWTTLCLVLATVFTLTTAIIFTFDHDGWREPGADQRPDRIVLHALNALIGFYFALRFSRGLHLPEKEALQWAWTTGHAAGAIISALWLVARVPHVLSSSSEIEWSWSWSSLSFVVPSLAGVVYIALTAAPLRARLLRWMWAGRTSSVTAAAAGSDGRRAAGAGAGATSRPRKSPSLLLPTPALAKGAGDEAAPPPPSSSSLESTIASIRGEHSPTPEDKLLVDDDSAEFRRWLHPQLLRTELVCLGVLTFYFGVQVVLSHGAFAEVFVSIVLLVLLAARLVGGWQHRDGQMWCVALLMSHGVEASTIAFGPVSRAVDIGAPRLAYRELAAGACLLIGLVHGAQPISFRARFAVAAVFELAFLLWLVPTWGTDHLDDGHPARLPSGATTPGWVSLVTGCAAGFAFGFLSVHVLVQTACRPLWLAGREAVARANLRQEQLTTEKERLYHEMTLAKHELSKLRGRSGRSRSSRSRSSRREGSEDGSDGNDTCGTSSEILGLGMCDDEQSVDPLVYKMSAEYTNERLQSGVDVEYCSPTTLRERHLLIVHNGRLVNRDGHPLCPHAPPIGEEALYVLSVDNDVLVSFETTRHRHSSLVAGAPVRAAGCLRVRNGELISINNASGHYRPPHQTLSVMASWLAERGVPMGHVVVCAAPVDESAQCEQQGVVGLVSSIQMAKVARPVPQHGC